MAANPNDGDGFFPMTVIDTGHIRDPSEHIYRPGQYFNPTEARLVVQIIDHLLRICHPGRLDNEIAVIAPYARQVRHIQQELLNSEVIRTPQQRNQIGILVCTVDSMQGSEAAVVIFSATRSNHKGLAQKAPGKRRTDTLWSFTELLKFFRATAMRFSVPSI